LPIVLYGCETTSLTLTKSHRLRVFENTVLRIFRPKMEEVAVEWRRLYNEELHSNLYALRKIIKVTKSRRMRWVGH